MLNKAREIMPAYEKMRKQKFIKITIIVGLVGVLVGFAAGSYWIARSTFIVEMLDKYLQYKQMQR